MKTLYLIRHAQSQANVGGKVLPDWQIPLTEVGLQQALQLARQWEIVPSALYCSQLLRTQQTAQPLAEKYQLTVQILPELNEFSYLSLEKIQQMTLQQRQDTARQFWQTAQPHEHDAPNCDSFADFSQRVDDFYQQIPRFSHNSVVVTHGIWIARLIWQNLGFTVKDNADMQRFRQFLQALNIANTAIFAVHYQQSTVQIVKV